MGDSPEFVSVVMSSRRSARKALKSGISEAIEDSPYLTKSEAREIVEQASDTYSVEELRDQLPEDIFEAVMAQLDLDDSLPESMEEVGKSADLAEELYDGISWEESDSSDLEKGSIGTDPVSKVGTLGASHHLSGESPFEDPEVDISKSPAELDRFYEDVEGE